MTITTQIPPGEFALRERRRDAMAVLAASDAAEIARCLDAVGQLPPHQDLRAGESGMVMVRGRTVRPLAAYLPLM